MMTPHAHPTTKTVFGLPGALFLLLVASVVPELILQLADRGIVLSPALRTWAYALGAFQPDLNHLQGQHFWGQPLTMFLTYGFLHTGLSHLVINMVGLVWLGRLILSYRTPDTFVMLYFMSMVGGAQVYALIGINGSTVVGASGALFGLFGAYAVDTGLFASSRPQAEDAGVQFFRLALATVLLALADVGSQIFLGSSPAAWQVHAGGFLTGSVIALLSPPRLRATLTAVLPTRTGQTSDQMAPLPCPNLPVCVIGDLHGRLDLLDRMLDRITDKPGYADARLVFVGDMIDRGPDSAGVLARLHALHRSTPTRIICLMGNHERMMLDFLADPARHGPRWIAAGGAETLTSVGLSPFARNHGTDAWDLLAAELRRRLTPDVIGWLGTLPLLWREGALVVTHAGADPDLPIDAQAPRRLLWGARHPEISERTDGLWVAHGHTITSVPYARAGRISVDTGAWRSGTLSAAWMDASGLVFFDVLDTN